MFQLQDNLTKQERKQQTTTTKTLKTLQQKGGNKRKCTNKQLDIYNKNDKWDRTSYLQIQLLIGKK